MTKQQQLNYSFKFPAPLMAELDEWRAQQPMKISRSEAMRVAIAHLVRSGVLKVDDVKQQSRGSSK